MKRAFILFAIFSLLLVGPAFAQGPWLVCDPMDNSKGYITHFEIELNDEIIEVQPTEVNATHIKIRYSLEGLSGGSYEARARSANEEWGKTSAWTEYISWNVPSDGDMPSCPGLRVEGAQ